MVSSVPHLVSTTPDHAGEARPASVHFGCHACGKCCDSAPEMSLPELLRNEHRFIGCLSVRRIPRVLAGKRVFGDVLGTAEDARQSELIAERLLHGPLPSGDYVHLSTRAFSYESEARCPALGADGLCTIHGAGKPATCDVAPLDALLADSLQPVLLRQRKRESDAWQAGCLELEPKPGHAPLTRHLSVVDPRAGDALARRRRALALDRELWGAAVFRLLGPDTFARGGPLGALDANTSFTLSVVPALAVVAGSSDTSHARVLAYVSAQEELIGRTIDSATLRRNPRDREDTNRLRGFRRAHLALRSELAKRPERTPPKNPRAEAWLLGADLEP